MGGVDKQQQKFPKVDMLTPTQRAFVIARAHGKNVAQAAEAAGINRATPATKWDMELINEAIAEIQKSWIASPADAMQALLPIALQQLSSLLNEKDFNAIQEVLNRAWGKPIQRTEVTGKDGEPLYKAYVVTNDFNPDDA